MFNKLLDIKKEEMVFNGFYRGIVKNINDPLKAGRIRVKIYPLFENVFDNDLPWAIPADTSFGGAANVGGINVPILESHVFVFFENGDHRFPVYFAAAPAIQNDIPDVPTLSREDDGTVAAINAAKSSAVATASGGSWDEPASAYAAVYPQNRVYRSEKGIIVEIDDTADNIRFHVYHPSGTRTEIDNAGNKVEHIKATKTTVIVGNDNIHVQGNHDTTTDGTHGINIGTNGKIKVGGTYDIDVTGNTTITVAGTTTINSTGDATVHSDGKAIVTSGGDTEITATGNAKVNATKFITACPSEFNNGTIPVIIESSPCLITQTPHVAGSTTVKAPV